MGRKKGFDERKISTILSILANNPDGIWLRRIAKESGLSPATISHYLDTILSPLVESVSLGEKPLLKVFKLRPMVAQKLQEGRDIKQIMRLLNVLNKIK